MINKKILIYVTIIIVSYFILETCANHYYYSWPSVAEKDYETVEEFVTGMDQQIPQWLDSMSIPGASFALIDDGKIVFEKGYGYADVAQKIPVTPYTGFNIASISKTLTAWGIMKLVDQGQLDLDQPIDKYLTKWHLPASKFSHNAVTIRRILSHTAGLSVHGFPGYSEKKELPSIEQVLNGESNTDEAVRIIQEPGKSFRYSGGGTTILQLIIEETTGSSFEDYMQKEIFEPLNMNNTSFTIDESILSGSSLAHDEDGDVIPLVLFTAKAAAGAHTTLRDFGKFALASLDSAKEGHKYKHSQTVVNASSVDLMTSLAQNSYQTGLGYQVNVIIDGLMTLVGHEGNNTGWNAFFTLNRASGDGFIMLTNGGSHRNVYRLIESEWLRWKLSKYQETSEH